MVTKLSEIVVVDPECEKTYPGSGFMGQKHRIQAPAPQHCFPAIVMHNSVPASAIFIRFPLPSH